MVLRVGGLFIARRSKYGVKALVFLAAFDEMAASRLRGGQPLT